MSEQGSSPQPGWYADPNDASQLRWWDGGGWTDHTRAHEAAPGGAVPGGTQASAGGGSVASAPRAAAEPGSTPSSVAGSAPSPAPSSSGPPSAGGGTASAPAPQAAAGGRNPVAEWFSVRSNQILFAILVIAIALFVFVMAGGAT